MWLEHRLMGRHLGGWLTPRAERWIGLALCAGIVVGWAIQRLVPSPSILPALAPDWLSPAAAGIAAAALAPLEGPPLWRSAQKALWWCSLCLMVWSANGLPLDVLRVVGLIPVGVDWAELATRGFALGVALVLIHPALALPADPRSLHPATWYGYAAFVFAMPYPVLRTIWAFGGTLGLGWPGAAGEGVVPWLFSIPWLVAAAVSLLLVSPPRWIPRRLLLAGGWSGTAIVGMIGPAACWSLVAAVLGGADPALGGIELWVFALFYGSWLLWAIVAGAATRSYQLRSAAARTAPPV